nr:ATP-binding protein [Anaerolineae bacterium]
MKILRYECHGKGHTHWSFTPVEFQKMNLLVGDSATGKTRLLNTLFNLGSFVAADKFVQGKWDITFLQSGITYKWVIETDDVNPDEDSRIIFEKLEILGNEESQVLVDRRPGKFRFSSTDLPKLPARKTAISLLREEEVVQPIFNGFENIRRRRFFHDDLARLSHLEAVSLELHQKFDNEPTLRALYKTGFGLNTTLYLMDKYFPDLFTEIEEQFKIAFSFVSDFSFRDLAQVSPNVAFPLNVPVFCIRERNQQDWIPLPDMSSGMQKILLILTDIYSAPDDSIYIIDEYENSLGISAIDFFPDFILRLEKQIQFFVTSHHPYIINDIPSRNWYLFHRKGTDIQILYGEELEGRFGKSKQEAFIQLINDPFYTDGVE